MTSETATANRTRDRRNDRSIAEWFCLIFGVTLILVGVLGFFVEPKFDTSIGGDPGQIDGEKLILFEVNGWHNVVHILTGAFLLVFGLRRDPRAARSAAIGFGVVYVIVSIIGLIDGQDIVGLVPINPADNVLHLLLAATAILAGALTRPDPERERALGAGADAAGAGRRGQREGPDARGRVTGGATGARAESDEYLRGRRDERVGEARSGDEAATGELPPRERGRNR